MCAFTIYNGYRYGVPQSVVDNSDIYVIDPAGIAYMQHSYKGSKGIVVIGIWVPAEVRAERMVARGDNPDEVDARIRYDKMCIRDRSDLDSCKITIDADGVARNSIGRALADDMLEKVELVAPDCVNVSATRATYAAEVGEALKGYASRQPNDEEMHEMRSAFGTGTTVVDVLSGRRYAV